jgi:hypothetical protein
MYRKEKKFKLKLCVLITKIILPEDEKLTRHKTQLKKICTAQKKNSHQHTLSRKRKLGKLMTYKERKFRQTILKHLRMTK